MVKIEWLQVKAQASENDRCQVGHVDANQCVADQLMRHLNARYLL